VADQIQRSAQEERVEVQVFRDLLDLDQLEEVVAEYRHQFLL
jgi:hypothetical protein